MSLSEHELQKALDNPSRGNAPARLHGPGLTGPREVISVAQQRDRRESLAQLLSVGVSRDRIMMTMCAATRPDGKPGFNMTERGVKTLISEIYQMWRDEDAEDRPAKKSAAVRRIKHEIARASAKHNYAAVAQLERTLMQIEGTAEPIEVNINGVDRISIAMQQVLNVQTPGQLAALVEDQKAYLLKHSKVTPTLIPAQVIDAHTAAD